MTELDAYLDLKCDLENLDNLLNIPGLDSHGILRQREGLIKDFGKRARDESLSENPISGLAKEISLISEANFESTLEFVFYNQAVEYWGKRLDDDISKLAQMGNFCPGCFLS